MCRFQIGLTIFLTLRLDFEDLAHVFRTWSRRHEILKIIICTTYKNIGDGELTASELLEKYRKSVVLTHTNDPCGSLEIFLTAQSILMIAQSLLP